jgi:hypothetical protein
MSSNTLKYCFLVHNTDVNFRNWISIKLLLVYHVSFESLEQKKTDVRLVHIRINPEKQTNL